MSNETNLNPESSLSAQVIVEKPESQWRAVWDSLKLNKAAMVSLFFIIFLVLIAVVTAIFPQILPHDPYYSDMTKSFVWPCKEYIFGTDQLGRDIFSRILIGTRVSLTVGVVAVAISMTVGVFLGSLAGYLGGKVDIIIMRFMDIMLSIPSILLAIAFMAALGQGIDKAIIAISLVSIPEYARIVRGEILSVKENDYVQAAKVIGNKNARIIFRHVLPNVLSSIIVRGTLGISSAILDAAALGFLGLGVQPPAAEWGDMLGRSRNFIFQSPYTLIFPGLAITLTVLAFNLLGDGLRDALDPKSRQN
jgi:peptide/nickel transport system permease protein